MHCHACVCKTFSSIHLRTSSGEGGGCGGENEREWGVILFSLASPAAHSLFITNEEHAAQFAGGIIIEIPCYFFTESNQEETIFILSL